MQECLTPGGSAVVISETFMGSCFNQMQDQAFG